MKVEQRVLNVERLNVEGLPLHRGQVQEETRCAREWVGAFGVGVTK